MVETHVCLSRLTICLLFLSGTDGRRGRTGPHIHSNACYGSFGVNQTANVIECLTHLAIPRICITNVHYGTKRRGPGEPSCPISGVSSPVNQACCESARGDCVIQATEAKKKEIQAECFNQSMSSCRIQVDQAVSREFLRCTVTSTTSLFRYIGYSCITDSDEYAKRKGCYTPTGKTTPAPIVTTTTESTTTSTTPEPTRQISSTSTSVISIPEITILPRGTSRNRPGNGDIKNKETTMPTTTEDGIEGTIGQNSEQKSSGLSRDKRIIVAVSVSVVGIVILVIAVMAACTFYRRKQLKIKNKFLENNLNKDRLNNTHDSPSTADVECGVSENQDVTVHRETEDGYNEENEGGTGDVPNSERVRHTYGQKLHYGRDETDERINTSGADIGSPLYKSSEFGPPAYSKNIRSDEKMKKIVDKIINTDDINVFKSGSKYGVSEHRNGYDSDTATLRRVAMFVKKCIRDIDISDRRRAPSNKSNRRKRRPTLPVNGSRHRRSDKRAKKQKKIVVKPWDFIHGSKTHDEKKVKHRKSSLKKSEDRLEYSDVPRRESDDSETSHTSAESSDEEVVCRFPIRQRSVMRRKRRKSGNSDSIPSTSESDQTNPRNLEVRFHKKLTYIDSEKGSRNSQHTNKNIKKRNKDRYDEANDASAANSDLNSSTHGRSSAEWHGRIRRDSLDLKDSRSSHKKGSHKSPKGSILQRDVTRKVSRKKQKNKDVGSDVKKKGRRHSNVKRAHSHPVSSRTSSKRQGKHRVSSKSRKNHSSASSRKTRRVQKQEREKRDYVTDSDDITSSESENSDY